MADRRRLTLRIRAATADEARRVAHDELARVGRTWTDAVVRARGDGGFEVEVQPPETSRAPERDVRALATDLERNTAVDVVPPLVPPSLARVGGLRDRLILDRSKRWFTPEETRAPEAARDNDDPGVVALRHEIAAFGRLDPTAVRAAGLDVAIRQAALATVVGTVRIQDQVVGNALRFGGVILTSAIVLGPDGLELAEFRVPVEGRPARFRLHPESYVHDDGVVAVCLHERAQDGTAWRQLSQVATAAVPDADLGLVHVSADGLERRETHRLADTPAAPRPAPPRRRPELSRRPAPGRGPSAPRPVPSGGPTRRFDLSEAVRLGVARSTASSTVLHTRTLRDDRLAYAADDRDLSSGSAVTDRAGRVCGMHLMAHDGIGIGVPATTLARLAKTRETWSPAVRTKVAHLDRTFLHARRGAVEADAAVSALVHVRDRAWEPLNRDVTVRARVPPVYMVQATAADLASLQDDPAVVRVEAGGGRAHTDSQVADGVATVAPPAPDDAGEHCLIAVLDDGIDVEHHVFHDGKVTALVGIWDQRAVGGVTPAERFPEKGAPDFGRWFDPLDIDAFLAKPTPDHPLATMRGPHGTGVASVAAGRTLGDRLGGQAPGAPLLIVRLADEHDPADPDRTPIGYAASAVAALNVVEVVARWLEAPVVVNLSKGTNRGAHDGSTALEAAFDAFTDNGRRPGRVVVKSAGNFAGAGLHDVLGPEGGALSWIAEASDRETDILELWFPPFNVYDAVLAGPGLTGDGVTSMAFTPEPGGIGTMFRGHAVDVGVTVEPHHPDNGDTRVLISIRAADGGTIPKGEWSLDLTPRGTVGLGGAIHAWLDRETERTTHAQPVAFVDPDPRYSLTVPGTSHAVVVIGASDLESSSRGPTRDGRPKPDVVTPGTHVVAEAETSAGEVKRTGTSYAAPFVAGVVARAQSDRIAAELAPLTANQIAGLLAATAQPVDDEWTEGAGYGVFDADAFLDRAAALRDPAETLEEEQAEPGAPPATEPVDPPVEAVLPQDVAERLWKVRKARLEAVFDVRLTDSDPESEAIIGAADFLPTSFLRDGVRTARAVCRLPGASSSSATGFLIAPRILLTNEHVFPERWRAEGVVAEFDYEPGLTVVRAPLRPDLLYYADESLDVAFVAVEPAPIADRTPLRLLRSPATTAVGDRAFIIQHPDGRPKEVVLHDNAVTQMSETALRYETDTEPGSSGSPVFNLDWELVALHRGTNGNENLGTRIAAIVGHVLENADAPHPLAAVAPHIHGRNPFLGIFDVHGMDGSDAVSVPSLTADQDFADVGFWALRDLVADDDARVDDVASVVHGLQLDALCVVGVDRVALARLGDAVEPRGFEVRTTVWDTDDPAGFGVIYDWHTTRVDLWRDFVDRHRARFEVAIDGARVFPRIPMFAELVVNAGRAEERRVLTITVHLDAGGASAASRRARAAEVLADMLAIVRTERPGLPVVIGGDHNEFVDTATLSGDPGMFALTLGDPDNDAFVHVAGAPITRVTVARDVPFSAIDGDSAAVVHLDEAPGDVDVLARAADHHPLVMRLAIGDGTAPTA